MSALLRRLCVEEHAQDLIEYALLGSFVALVAVAGFNALSSAIGSTYQAWNTNENSNWQMPAPSGS